jgi:hypothetical protein
MQGKGAGAVNRVELESQVLCAALRQSCHLMDKIGGFTSVRELSHLFPDLLPSPERDDEASSVNKSNYYHVLKIKPQTAANGVLASYLRAVRRFLRTSRVADARVEFIRILNAGFILRRPRLRLSHDMVVARRWLHEESRLSQCTQQEITVDGGFPVYTPTHKDDIPAAAAGKGTPPTPPTPPAVPAAPSPPPLPVSAQSSAGPMPPPLPTASPLPPVPAAAQTSSIPPPLPSMANAGGAGSSSSGSSSGQIPAALAPLLPPLPASTVGIEDEVRDDGFTTSLTAIPVPPPLPVGAFESSTSGQAAMSASAESMGASEAYHAIAPDSLPSMSMAAAAGGGIAPPPLPDAARFGRDTLPLSTGERYPAAPEAEIAAQLSAEPQSGQMSPGQAYDTPPSAPAQAPAATTSGAEVQDFPPASVRAAQSAQEARPAATAPVSERASGRISKEAAFVFDENALRKPSTPMDMPMVVQLLEAAQVIGPLEVQALKAQMEFAPNVPVEKHILNAGYISHQELQSAKLGESLLQSGKITIAQFQVAFYDERISGLRMAESLQVRGWLSVEVRNAIDDWHRKSQ